MRLIATSFAKVNLDELPNEVLSNIAATYGLNDAKTIDALVDLMTRSTYLELENIFRYLEQQATMHGKPAAVHYFTTQPTRPAEAVPA